MAKTIALFNQKGGVGKTTTAVNLTAALTQIGRRVLLVDVDPQGHSTSGLGVDKDAAAFSSYNVLLEGVPISRAMVKTKYGSVIPANKGLFGAGIQLTSFEKREHVLHSALAEVQDEFDVIFIDCPALLELLTLNALVAADSLIIPVQCEYLALEGIADLMTSIKMLQRGLNPGLEIEGILLTMYDARTNLSTQVASEVKKHFKSKVFKTAIPRNVRLSEAPSHGKPVTAYDPASKGSTAYTELAKEINAKLDN